MAKIKDDLQKSIESRLIEKTPLIQFVLGPRQVGKTTAVVNLCQSSKKLDCLIADGDGVASANFIAEQWQKAQDEGKNLIIDEIQKIPDWSEMVKKLWDQSVRKNRIKCLFLGSSSLNLQKGIHESLTGRFEIIPAYHWNYQKTKNIILRKMTLDDYIIYGGYPGSYRFLKDKKRWVNYMGSSIIETVIGKDILTQAKVKSPALFKQTFYVLANLPAQVMSYNKILGQLQDKGNIDIVKYYIELFEAAFLIKSLPKFSKNEIRKKQSSPKIIAMAPALNTFHRLDNLSQEYLGRVFESLVGSALVKVFAKVYYWAEGDYEVDYVIEYKGQVCALEVKSGRNKKSKSLDVFLKKYPQAKVIYVTKDNYIKFESDPVKFIEKFL